MIRTPTTLTNRLRRWRVDNGLTLEETADITGLSPSMLSRVERGERELAPFSKIKVARRLGVRVADLFDVETIDEPVQQ